MDAEKPPMRAAFASVSRHLTLPQSIRLRKEYFGGIAFDASSGTMIELDREVMSMLQHIRNAGTVREDNLFEVFASQGERIGRVVESLLCAGILSDVPPVPAIPLASPDIYDPTEPWPSAPHLSAPETVHWALTYRCNSQCPDCYARRHSSQFTDELDTDSAIHVIDVLAKWRVFQIAFGGGEPLLRADLSALCSYAHKQGIAVHVTTGQHQIDADVLQKLADGVSVLQIGIKHEKLLADADKEVASLVKTVLETRKAGIHIGANLMLSNMVLEHFGHIVALLVEAGFDRITLLRYKPPADQSQWCAQNPPVKVWRGFENRLSDIEHQYPHVTLRLDCALSFLQRHLKPSQAASAGIRGCVAGNRILSLAPDGSVFPCSQMVHPNLRVGNILADNLNQIWTHSGVMAKYREFRSSDSYRQTWCGICLAKDHCGGCRVFSHDGIGGEPECVEPISPSLNQLGKTGRCLDLERYLECSESFSVREYMDRYGVSRKRAVQELDAASGVVVSTYDSAGRKLQNEYWSGHFCDLYDIQDSIGFTSGGAAFASMEEISESIADCEIDNLLTYPRWLLSSEYNVIDERIDSRPRKRRKRR